MQEIEQVKGFANDILEELGVLKAELESIEGAAEREMALVREKYSGRLDTLRQAVAVGENTLLRLMKEKKTLLFDLAEKKDQVNLDRGILLYGREDRVSIPRNALEKIEVQGWLEAIKVVKSVDRGVVEAWPDERLTVIGARRKMKEFFTYELRDRKEKQ